ncbi:MAG: radical SAM protein [Lentisphaeria bacterium]|nr:radical SAM protein [Lentisphaeria bacterium]
MFRLGWTLFRETGKRPLWKFVWNFGVKGFLGVRRFEKRLKRGEYFPAFLFISVTDQCNLRCQGCWVTPCRPARAIPLDTLRGLVATCRDRGVHFFGILGGEPLLYAGLVELFKEFPDCYFQLFTNGLLLDETVAAALREAGNVTPLISIEGDEEVGDQRRGGDDVTRRGLEAVRICNKAGLVTGVATSVCQSNIDTLATEDFLQRARETGAHYLWYYIYRPVGPRPCPELALTRDQILALRRFIVDQRTKAPLLIVDSYWDHLGRAMCPAVLGLAPHVGPGGDVEPCPPIQFSDRNVNDGDYADVLTTSAFLNRFREGIPDVTRGCVLMDDPAALEKLITDDVTDSTGRGTGRDELSRLTVCPSHHCPGEEIPEKSFWFRFVKKHWFFGFGAYG